MSNPWKSLVPLQEELLLDAAQPVAWLRDFVEPVGTTCQKDVQDQPKKLTEHDDLVCGVYSEVQGSEVMEQLQDMVLEFEDTFALDESGLGCTQPPGLRQDPLGSCSCSKQETVGLAGTRW